VSRPRVVYHVQVPVDYCRQLATLFGLAHWRIDFDPGDPGDDCLAAMRVISGQQRAALQIGRTYHSLSPEDQRSTMLHELLHIWLWQVTEVVEGVAALLGTHAAHVVSHNHDLAVERATDAISIAIAEHFPLPGGK